MTVTQSLEPDGGRVVAFPKPHSRAGAKRRRAYRRFKEALLGFSESPSTDNAIRYLAASRALRPTNRGPARDCDLPPAA
jgi:hypothetical protein